jgi:hypothetical protein
MQLWAGVCFPKHSAPPAVREITEPILDNGEAPIKGGFETLPDVYLFMTVQGDYGVVLQVSFSLESLSLIASLIMLPMSRHDPCLVGPLFLSQVAITYAKQSDRRVPSSG